MDFNRISPIKFSIFLLSFRFTQAQEKILSIPPAFQQTPEWCWVTCGEMIFRHFNICAINSASYQCGIIALIGPQCSQNCMSCPLPAGSTEVVKNMLYSYPQYAKNICGGMIQHVICTDLVGQCSSNELINNIQYNIPVIAGVSPSGGGTAAEAAHVILIVGFSENNGDPSIFVNDPFPYSLASMQDPYTFYGGMQVQPGQYKISLISFRQYFAWNRTLLNFQAN